MKHQQSGFTLIELVIVIILLGILTAVITPRFLDIQDNARQAIVDAGVGAVKSAALISFAANQGAPVNAAAVIANTDLDGEVVFNPALVCLAAGAGDTAFTLEHIDDTGITASSTIPNAICNL